MRSYIHSKEFQRKVAKVGPDSEFSYRSKFDPVPSSELKEDHPDYMERSPKKAFAEESYLSSKDFQEAVARVGPGSKFSYRSIFDPVPSSDLKESRPKDEEQ